MAVCAIASALRGFAAVAEKRDANVRLSQKGREQSQIRSHWTSDALQLQRVIIEEKRERIAREKACCVCFSAVFLAIIVGGAGGDAELVRNKYSVVAGEYTCFNRWK